jgi:hypothetical protein
MMSRTAAWPHRPHAWAMATSCASCQLQRWTESCCRLGMLIWCHCCNSVLASRNHLLDRYEKGVGSLHVHGLLRFHGRDLPREGLVVANVQVS